MEIATGGAPGPMPYFQQYHLLMALLLIREKGYIGRKQLSRELSMGEGSIRSMLRRLTKAGLVRTERSGNVITPAGGEMLNDIGIEMISIEGGESSVGTKDVAVIVPGKGNFVTDGFSQRDAAVKAGALGATTLVFRNGGLTFPPDQEPMQDQAVLHQLKNVMRSTLRDNDVVIIGTADSGTNATIGALAAAMELL
ncbi:MAG: DUF4443 domain-containing protein [Candidatus Thermoplasmatota archaeon]|jgi:predicted transcriptional regulator|nr:DUF4443 domain-containing protein [Candidatus Thermoplasmatota archaeon]